MQVNFTLVVQAINFFIAYVLLDRLIIRLAFSTIKNEEKKEEQTQQSIIKQKASVAQIEQLTKQKWHEYQQIFEKTIPTVMAQEVPIDRIKGIDMSPVNLPEEQKERLINEMAHYFEDEIQKVL